MSELEKAKKLVRRRKLAKIEKEVIAIGAGAGCWWQDDGYWEHQDDPEKCIGALLHGVHYFYDLPLDCSLFRPWNLKEFASPRSAARAILSEVEYQKEREKHNAECP